MTATAHGEQLQRWLAAAREVGAGRLSEAEVVDRIRALEELKAIAAGEQARLTAHLYAERARREAAEQVLARRRCAGLGAEIALARRVSPHQGNRHLGVALALTRELPQTFAALSAGQISEWRATLVVRETAVLSAEHRLEVDRQLARHLTGSGWGDRQVANEARRIGYRLDHRSAIRRVRGATADRHVSLRPAPDTMTYLTGFLPVAHGVACKVALMKHADTLKAQGDQRSRAQIMADTLVERLTGQATATGTPVKVNLVMTDQALFNGSNEPAHLLDYGTLPAELARRLLTEADRAWARRLFTHRESGALVAMDSRSRCFPRGIQSQIRVANDTC